MALQTQPDAQAVLNDLLAESPASARRRAATTFDSLAGRTADLVLFGAGGLGRRVLAGLRQLRREPLAFADNNSAAWGTTIEGVPVLSPADAAERYRDSAAFVVSIWRAGGTHRYGHSRAQLQQLGVRHIAHAAHLFWKHPEVFPPFYALDLPHHVLEQKEEVRQAFDLLNEDLSRVLFLEQIRWRLRLDFDGLSPPGPEPQYFPPDFFAWSDEEVFIDVGAYDGDTVREITQDHGGRFCQLVCLEPDPVNYQKLMATVAALPPDVRERVATFPFAVGETRQRLRIDASGLPSSTTGTGTQEVECVRLDDFLRERRIRPTYIKMDIEGAEPAALRGSRESIRDYRPILAVCAYHEQNHLWKIPRMIAELDSGYRLFFRGHNEEAWDFVCYAVPPERSLR